MEQDEEHVRLINHVRAPKEAPKEKVKLITEQDTVHPVTENQNKKSETVEVVMTS